MPIDRRQLVQVALIASLWPAYWAAASTLGAPNGAVVPGPVPVLVLVVPTDPWQRHQRGRELGALLNHGSDRALAALALCEVSCAVPAAIEASYGLVVAADVAFVLVEPDGRTRVAGMTPLPEEHDDELEERAWVEAVGEQVVQLIAPDRSALVRYATAAGPGSPAQTALDSGLDTTLADLARDRWVERVVPGSRWMINEGGCGGLSPESPTIAERLGELVEGVSRLGVMCGMAHTTRLTRRMLELYE